MDRSEIKKPVKDNIAKVPMIIQLEEVECGAASLSMVLAYYDKWIPLEKMRVDCGVSRDGSSAKNIVKAARMHGLEADGFRCEPEGLRKNGTFPCIIHWNMNHFVVLKGFKGDKAYINDPGLGSYAVSMEEFSNSFTGICILFEPTEELEPSGQQKKLSNLIKKRVKGNGKAIAFFILMSAAASLLAVFQPAFSEYFLDTVLDSADKGVLLPFIILLAIFDIILITVSWIEAVFTFKLSGRLEAESGMGYMKKVFQLPMTFFSQRSAGDIRGRLDTNTETITTLVQVFAPLVIDAIMLILYLVIMLANSFKLALIGIGSIVLNALISSVISKRTVDFARVQMRDSAKLASATVSGLEMIETIKAGGAEQGFFVKWSGLQANVNNREVDFLQKNFPLTMILHFISLLSDVFLIIMGAFLVIKGEMALGLVVAMQGYLTAFLKPAESFIDSIENIHEMRAQMERVDDVMDYPDDIIFGGTSGGEESNGGHQTAGSEESNGGHQTAGSEANNGLLSAGGEEYSGKLTGNIELKNITFGYSSLEEPLIKDLNLSIKAGSHVAFVGSSGCGKSTVSKLISGLNKPWSGEILFDGKNMKDIDKGLFNSSVAVVDQDIIMFEGSIDDNIKMWDSTIQQFEVILAARDARIHDEIMQRSGGYRCTMDEGGRNFSGGQLQRMEIARVLAQDPSIIILDEATSALDAKTEYEVVNAIKDRGCTCIFIAHRLSTIRDCDEIIVLDHGTISGRGSHEELLSSSEIYRTLISSE